MRLGMLLLAAACVGCRTAEVAINYPVTGIQIAAKFEAREKPASVLGEHTAPIPSGAASSAHAILQ